MSARISVVVPIYNVAPYLEECLESLAEQTATDLEIVMVDDGSTDESAEIAARLAARDGRFRLVHQPNAGLGAARNTGSDHATGEFIAFVDSDDVVPRGAYEVLLDALDRSGSDFATGNARRLTSLGTVPAAFLGNVFKRTRLGTHITHYPALLVDRTAWNKLFRRSFWDRHAFRFPEGVLYEDIPVTLPAHYLAKAVDVVEQTIYLWRMREGGDLSITQRRTETRALRDRVSAVDHVSRFLAAQRLVASKWRYDRTVVGHDLRYFLDVLPVAPAEYHALFLELVNDFLDRADPAALDQPLAIDRLKWHLVRRRALPELLEVLRFQAEEREETPPVRIGRRWYGDYPYRRDARLAVPDGVYKLEGELAPVVRVNDLRWEDDTLRIEGYAYIDSIGAPEPDSQRVSLWARRTDSLVRRTRLTVERVHRPDVTANAAQQLASLDWSGFVATLDAAHLRHRGTWREGTWELGIAVRAGGVVRRSSSFDAPRLQPVPVAELSGADGSHVQAEVSVAGELVVTVRRPRTVVRSATVDDGVLQLEGDAGAVRGRKVSLVLERRGGSATMRYPAYVDRSGERAAFLARVPVADLAHHVDVADRAAHSEEAEGVAWDVHLASGSGRASLALADAMPEAAHRRGDREVVVQRTPYGALALVERTVRPIVTRACWLADGVLLVEGRFAGAPGEYDLVAAARGGTETHTTPLRYDTGAGAFTVKLETAAIPSLAGARPLGHGGWRLLVRRRGSALAPAPLAFAPVVLGSLPLTAQVRHREMRLGVAGDDAVVLAVERDLEPDERGGFAQRRLRTSFYRARRERPLRDAILYDCFGGREYGDSPRAVHEELVRRGAPFDHLWVVRDERFEPPPTAIAVRELGREYYGAYATARYVVANDHWPRWFRRRHDQTCVQTWHGVPLKRLGRNLADRPRAIRDYWRALAEHAENWQHVVSPGAFATPILERAFPIGGEVIETGLPRTDVLAGAERERVGEEVKRRLGVEGRRVVLYAPTFRDHLDYGFGQRATHIRDLPTYRADPPSRSGYRLGQLLDLEALRAALGEDDVVLFRKHPRVVEMLTAFDGLVSDVSDHPDAIDLLAAADVLVTDYSSLVFDYATTGRPIVFYTPDLEAYRDDIRGFSIDFEADAPGPLLHTSDAVVEALQNLDRVVEEYRPRYERFVASYCGLNDGGAAARVVDAAFRW